MKLYYSVKHIFLKVRAIWKNTWKYGLKDKLMWAKRTEIQPDQRFLDKYGSLSSLHRILFCFKHSCVGPEKVFYILTLDYLINILFGIKVLEGKFWEIK